MLRSHCGPRGARPNPSPCPPLADLRALARALDARAAALDDDDLPAFVRELLARCHDDVAVIFSSTEPDIEALLDLAQIESFEQLRGLVRAQ